MDKSRKRILMIKARSMGDAVVMTPAIREVHNHFGNPEIYVVTSEAGAAILKTNPFIHELFIYRKKPFISQIIDLIYISTKLKLAEVETAFCFYASFTDCLLARLSGASSRVIYRHEYGIKDTFGNVPIRFKKEKKSIIERDLDVLRSFDVGINDKKTEIFIPVKEKIAAENFLASSGIREKPAVIFPFAGRPEKHMELDEYFKIAAYLREEKKYAPVFILPSGRLPAGLTERLEKGKYAYFSGPAIEAAALISMASVFIGNDTGFKHIAVALGVPSVTAVSVHDMVEWHSYCGQKHRAVVYKDLAAELRAADFIDLLCRI